jgi:hypothetical protein
MSTGILVYFTFLNWLKIIINYLLATYFLHHTGCLKYVPFGLGYDQVEIFVHSDLNREI